MINRAAFILSLCLLTGSTTAEVLTIYSDEGFPSSDVFAGGLGATFNGDYTGGVAPEGNKSFQTIAPNWFFWGYAYPTAQNLSRFNSGELRFWANSNTGDTKVEIKNSADVKIREWKLNAVGWTPDKSGQWVLIRIPLAGVILTDVKVPFVISLDAPNTIYIDNIRYIDSTGSIVFNPTIKTRGTNAPSSEITWDIPNLPVAGGWQTANQYIELTADMNVFPWGVQIYTDNRGLGANPSYTGAANTNPAGLVDSVATSQVLPLAWSIRGNLNTVVSPADPNSNVVWMYFKDVSTPNIPGVTSPLVNGEYYATVRNQQGIHWGVSDMPGPDNTPDYIYLQANFSQAVTPRLYRTNKLILELFTL